jgi:hypothetical protein
MFSNNINEDTVMSHKFLNSNDHNECLMKHYDKFKK